MKRPFIYILTLLSLLSIASAEKEIGNCAISPGSISNPFSDMVLYSSHSNSKALTTTTSEPELNNGRYVTLLDLGRFDFVLKIKLHRLLKRKKWSLTVAGTYNEYRHRIRLFQQFTLNTSIIGYDERWFYFLQKAERNGKIHFSSVVKTAFTSKEGLVSAESAIKEMKLEHLKIPLPDWIHPLTNQEIIEK